ncbi:hypothetical protein [Amphibacillus jilinensis]|uniref:hypothetical protein n=1 Tax=Amphibacillus jilinensis TaxID=1216008 RepID=UPI000307EB06|nr:hypothetical protein [Amphibacillus jilinensis]
MENDTDVVVPVDVREMSIFESDIGEIHVIHEITLGDLMVSTALVAMIVFMLIARVSRRD